MRAESWRVHRVWSNAGEIARPSLALLTSRSLTRSFKCGELTTSGLAGLASVDGARVIGGVGSAGLTVTALAGDAAAPAI